METLCLLDEGGGSFSSKVSSIMRSLLSEAALASLLPPSGLEYPHIYVILLQALACAAPEKFSLWNILEFKVSWLEIYVL